MVTKIQKWGNSQGLRFPKSILNQMNIHVGDEVDIQVLKGRIIIKAKPVDREKISLETLVSQIPEGYQPEEAEWGKTQGKEAW